MEVRKTVTVVFADVTGSTSLGENLDPESMRGVMSRYFDQMRSAIEAHGGTVEKFIGDAVMGAFGVPVVHEDDALRGVRAASQMRDLLSSLNADLEREWGASIQIRIGVNSGEVVAGDPSSGQTFVTGDAVNVAARLEQAAEPGEILIGDPTYRLVRDAVRVEEVEPLELKGKAERVPVWRLVEVDPGAPGLARRLDSPLVGRDEELARLQKVFEEVVALSACRVATLLGDAGAGKSRLAAEFAALVGDRARTLWGRCLPYGEGITFWPVAEMIKSAAEIDERDAPEAARSKVGALTVSAEDGSVVADRVGGAIGLGGTVGDLRETFWAVRRMLEIVAADDPLLVMFEDVHWAEPTFLDLVQYVAGFSAEHPILVVCTSRPEIRETRPDWATLGDVIALPPLSEDESTLLIENLLGHAGLTGDVRARVTEAAEGNPLFVEELLRMLIDEGRLERTNGHWTARGDLATVSVPGSISALLSARLDQLQVPERGVIQRAAVIGKVFWWGAVTELSPSDERASVGSSLQTLLRKELVRPDRSGFAGEDAFRFSHILVRDAAYESMPKRARADLHERFAAWLSSRTETRIAEFEEIVGYHLERSYRYRAELGPLDDAGRAVGANAAERLAAAGRRALARWDIAAADNLLSRAADLLAVDDLARPGVLADLGKALAAADIPRANLVLAEARDLARAGGDVSTEARAGVRFVFVRLLLDPLAVQADSLREVEGYAARFEAADDALGLAEALNLIGTIRFWQGRIAACEESFARAIDFAGRAGDHRQEAESLRWLALATTEGPAPATDGVRRLRSILEESGGDHRVEISVARNRATLEAMMDRPDEARALIARAKLLARELGDHVAVAGTLRNSGYVEMLAGDVVAAEAELREGYEALERLRDFGHLASHAPDLGDAVYELGRYEEALRISEFAEGITIEGDMDAQVRWRQLRGKALARAGRHEEALAVALDAVQIVAATEFLDVHAHAVMSLAEVHRLAGRTAESAAAAREGLDLYRQKGNLVGERRAQALLDELDS